MTRVRQIFVGGRMVNVTPLMVEIAQLLWDRRHPYKGRAWDAASAREQMEFLEDACAVMAHPIFGDAGACQRAAQG